ncbi:MAG: nucleoside deaminase [Terriglobia bacterium]
MMTGQTHQKPRDARAHDVEFMRQAIRLARIALERGDTPVGSVVVCDGRIVGEGIEAVRSEKDLTAHAELKAVREACRTLDSLNLAGCALYTTVEPCFMCSFIIRSAHLSRVVTGKAVSHIGGISSNHPILIDPGFQNWPRPPELVTGVLEEECRALFTR